jgi:hypothetical protein
MNINRTELNQLLQVIEEHELLIPYVINLIKVSQPLPTEMTIGGRTYEIISLLRENEQSVTGHMLTLRVKAKNADLGEIDGQHILKNQAEIPKILRGKIKFFFSTWHISDYPETVWLICWNGDEWELDWDHLSADFGSEFYSLRYK